MTKSLQEKLIEYRETKDLLVRVRFPRQTGIFCFAAKDEASKNDFIRRAKANGCVIMTPKA